MNGELYQLCCLVAAAKKALADHTEILPLPQRDTSRLMFSFLPRQGRLLKEEKPVQSVSEWFSRCREKELKDVKLLLPTEGQERRLLGFSNTMGGAAACFYASGASFFGPEWRFEAERKQWNVSYTEQAFAEPPREKPRFENNTESFQKVLRETAALAKRIDCGGFAAVFERALRLLNASEECGEECSVPLPPALPASRRPLFCAAELADVFGAMGSWNDSPPYLAHQKGLSAEYEALSASLLRNIRLAVLYAVNEW